MWHLVSFMSEAKPPAERVDGEQLPPLDEAVLAGFEKQFIFLDSNYVEGTAHADEELKRLKKLATKLKSTTRPINKEAAAENQTRNVHQVALQWLFYYLAPA